MMNIILNFFFVIGILPKNDIGVEIFTRSGDKFLLKHSNPDSEDILTTILIEKKNNKPLLFSISQNKEVINVSKCELFKVISLNDNGKNIYNLSMNEYKVNDERIKKQLEDSFKNRNKIWCSIDNSETIIDAMPYKMLTETECINIALFKIYEIKPDAKYMLINEKIESYTFGWVFYYSTKKYLETNDKKYIVPGNVPFIVDKLDGSIQYISLLADRESYFRIYSKHWKEKYDNFYR